MQLFVIADIEEIRSIHLEFANSIPYFINYFIDIKLQNFEESLHELVAKGYLKSNTCLIRISASRSIKISFLFYFFSSCNLKESSHCLYPLFLPKKVRRLFRATFLLLFWYICVIFFDFCEVVVILLTLKLKLDCFKWWHSYEINSAKSRWEWSCIELLVMFLKLC